MNQFTIETPLQSSAKDEIDLLDRLTVKELTQLFESLIKGQALAAAGTHLNETIRKITEAPNDQKITLLVRAFDDDPTLLDQLRAATGEAKGTFM